MSRTWKGKGKNKRKREEEYNVPSTSKQEDNPRTVPPPVTAWAVASTSKNWPPLTSEKVPANLNESSTLSVRELAIPLPGCSSKPDESAGPSTSYGGSRPLNDTDFQMVVSFICNIFPDCCPDYVKLLCRKEEKSIGIVDKVTTMILFCDGQYPKRKISPELTISSEKQLQIMKELLPDADPDYLTVMFHRLEGEPEKIKVFLNEAMEENNYPSRRNYERRQQLMVQQRQYTSEFTVENFVKIFPNPHAFFSDPLRVVELSVYSRQLAKLFLRNMFNRLPVRIIHKAYRDNRFRLYLTVVHLKYLMTKSHLWLKNLRDVKEVPQIESIPLLEEMAYIIHETEINAYLERLRREEEAEIREAQEQGVFITCQCCFDENVLPRNIFSCGNRCFFCKFCINQSVEIHFGEGKLDFPCLNDCPSDFSLQTLQSILSPKLFSKIAQKKTLEEVKAAGIEDLETCPFCDFATIPAEGYNIFTCFNPDCMKESCRTCKRLSHIPYKCDEVEQDEDVKVRTYLEDKMTEALLKKCWSCGIKYFKEEGCNKMVCSCGAQMCYICGEPVTDYKHFNGNGGDRYDLCPLFSDSNNLNKENVLRAVEAARREIGNKNLRHDPTRDIEEHYEERAAHLPNEGYEYVVVNNDHHGPLIIRMRNIQHHHPDMLQF